MKTLIVYFSHRKENYVSGNIKNLTIGNTEIVAQKIQMLNQGDLFEIEPLHEYPDKYHDCTKIAKQEYNHNERPKIINIVNHFDEYEKIYLGYPNWWSTMPMCVWTFLESYDFSNKHIYPFCSHEGSGLGKSLEDLKKLCPTAIIHQGLAVYGSEVNHADRIISEWVKENDNVN